MIQDIFPHVYHNEYHPHEPLDTDYVLSYENNSAILKSDLSFFQIKEVGRNTSYTYLFEIDDRTFYLGEIHLPHQSIPIFELRYLENSYISFACLTGWQLHQWLIENQYCGKCGRKMKLDTYERALRCEACNQVIYPRINPAVIVGVINDNDEILVTKYAHSAYKNYALVAGFAEIGETIEQTIIREVKEETGLDVDHIQYYKSQPWSLSGTLLFGFWCRAKKPHQIIIDKQELSIAQWITREELAKQLPSPVALTGEMMLKFVKGEHF